MLHRVFDRGELRIGDDVPGDADDEEVADRRIKDDLGADPRVAAADDDRVGMLA